ncbi:MAG: hypothetical protein ACK5UP_07175 [Bacteroidota bacterium]|jgi:hypothetical protein|nr:hypothetical protein [Cytophagales bacterium]MCE2957591.1 hypothetical protein [Flammeovirgaceae bacterium]MCZ8068807.1 hypothetical protein [Cytophagales bacterium]
MKMLKAIVNVFRFDRTNWRAAVLCMVAALVFWFFNALNKSYSTDVEFPVRFDYDLSQFAPVDALPHQLTVNVNGTGWELFREYVGFKQPELTIALQRPTEVRKIVGASLMPLLQPQLGKLKINYMVTDTLKIQLDEIEAHRFRVFAEASAVTYRDGFGRISPFVVLPDSIEITGPKVLLHTLPDSLPVSVVANRLDQNFEDDVEVILPTPFVKRNPALVNVMFEVGKVIKLTANVKVLPGKKTNQSLVGLPDSVGCRFLVPEKRLEDFHRHKIDMRLLWNGRSLKLQNKPSFVELIQLDTTMVAPRL